MEVVLIPMGMGNDDDILIKYILCNNDCSSSILKIGIFKQGKNSIKMLGRFFLSLAWLMWCFYFSVGSNLKILNLEPTETPKSEPWTYQTSCSSLKNRTSNRTRFNPTLFYFEVIPVALKILNTRWCWSQRLNYWEMLFPKSVSKRAQLVLS